MIDLILNYGPIVLGLLLLALIWVHYPRNSNNQFTSKSTIINQMNEPRPLPLGQKEFMEWSDRIISGAQIPCDEPDSLRKALSALIMQLPGTESHKPDAYFIHSLRKAAANEVAHANFQAIKQAQDQRFKESQAEAVTGPITS